MEKNLQKRLYPHHLTRTSISNLLRLYRIHGVDREYRWRATLIFIRNLLNSPLRLLERILYDRQVRKTPVNPPVFIIGYTRSGTTFFHHLMSSDPRFCYCTVSTADNPHCCILREKFKTQLGLEDNQTLGRSQDKVKFYRHSPWEEEMGLYLLGALSVHERFAFPATAREKSIDFNLASNSEISEWKSILKYLYQKISLMAGPDRTILSKMPRACEKIKLLLDVFPEARFIHIYRNPWMVFLSTVNMHKARLASSQGVLLQKIPRDLPTALSNQVIGHYKKSMNACLEQIELIPPDHFVDVRYENLKENPIGEMERIYQKLNIPMDNHVRQHFQNYLDTVKDYENNTYQISQEVMDNVQKELGYFIDHWGYTEPNRMSVIRADNIMRWKMTGHKY